MKTMHALMISILLAMAVVACEDNNMEDAADNMEDAVQDLGDAAENACEEASGENC